MCLTEMLPQVSDRLTAEGWAVVLTGETWLFLLMHAKNYRSANLLACDRSLLVIHSHKENRPS